MEPNAFDIQEGMDVFDVNGEKIGTISHIFTGAPFETLDHPAYQQGGELSSAVTSGGELIEVETVQVGEDIGVAAVDEIMPAAGTMGTAAAPAAPSAKYFEVHHGGILGMGGENFYVPFSAVQDLAPAECVTLDCTKEECVDRYSMKPAGIVEK